MQELFWRYGGRCAYCDCDTVFFSEPFGKIPENAATLDHIVPRAWGGTRSEDNSALACYRCNQLKGNLPAEVFKDLLARNAPEAEWRLARRHAEFALVRMRAEKRAARNARRRADRSQVSPAAKKLLATASPPGGFAPGHFDVLKNFTPAKVETEPCNAKPAPSCSRNTTDAAIIVPTGATQRATRTTTWRPPWRIASLLTAAVSRFLPARRASTTAPQSEGLQS